jgi:hypothetical protein
LRIAVDDAAMRSFYNTMLGVSSTAEEPGRDSHDAHELTGNGRDPEDSARTQ